MLFELREPLTLYQDYRILWLTSAGLCSTNECLDVGPSFCFCVLGLPHVTLIELRLPLITCQDWRTWLLTPAGLVFAARALNAIG